MMSDKINPNDYGLVIVCLKAHEQAEIPKGWAIRDTVTGHWRGCDIEGNVESLLSSSAWTKYSIGAWRGKTRAKAIAEARRYVVESGVELLSPREVKYFRYFKPWSPWPVVVVA